MNWFKETKPLKFHPSAKLKILAGYLCSCIRKRRDVKLEKLLKQSEGKIEKMLDLRTIIEQQRSLATITRLLLPLKAIKMVQM